MNGTMRDPICAPSRIGALAPAKMEQPLSSPILSALGIAFMQCIQRVHSGVFISSFPSSYLIQPVGQRSIISFWISKGPQLPSEWAPPFGGNSPPTYAATAFWSIFISSRQVPTNDRSERAIDATQQFGHPSNLNLNL